MKNIYIIILILFGLFSCQEEYELINQITSPNNMGKFTVGDTISISVEVLGPDDKIKDSKLFINDIGMQASTESSFLFQWSTVDALEGFHSIRIKTTSIDGDIAEDEIQLKLEKKIEEFSIPTDAFMDLRDSNIYRTVEINGLTWMAENLGYLPKIEWEHQVYSYFGSSVSVAKESHYYKTYGALYSEKVNDEVCPSGWRLPTIDEWRDLIFLIDSGSLDPNSPYDRYEVYLGVAKQLKAKEGWEKNGTDDYGFTALPGGSYDHESERYSGAGVGGTFLGTMEEGKAYIAMNSRNHDIHILKKYFGLASVRCVKNE